MFRVFLLLSIFGLAACGGSGGGNNNAPANSAPSTTAQPTLSPIDVTATFIVRSATQSANIPETNCETGIITEADAAAAASLKSALEANTVTVSRSNVMVTRDQQTCDSFTIANTFASVGLPVSDVTNDASLGTVAAKVLRVFVDADLPQPATISLQFEANNRQRSMNVNQDDAESYLLDNLTGADLIEEIEQ